MPDGCKIKWSLEFDKSQFFLNPNRPIGIVFPPAGFTATLGVPFGYENMALNDVQGSGNVLDQASRSLS